MKIDETWTYEAIYDITQADIDKGQVINQATVTAKPIGVDVQIFDLSDDDHYDQNEPTILSVLGACEDNGSKDFEIFNGITPNGDGLNDFFEIKGIENYPNNNVKIYNRWGILVYETNGYDQGINVFKGISNARATITEDNELPSGTYFYILTFPVENPGMVNYKGYLYINRD